MRPTWIPTVTGRREAAHAVVLCSPSAHWQMLRGRSHTIVDCHTYYLRFKRRNVQAAVAHYLHHLEFIKAHADDNSLTFISVDYDWLPTPERMTVQSAYRGLERSRYRWLAIPETTEFDAIDAPVGFAVTPKTNPRLWHPQWTHCLSKVIVHKPQCAVWTYDSVSPNED